DGDLARQIAFLDRSRDFGDVAHLRREVGRQLVDVVGQVLPGPGCSGHVSLAAQPSCSADLAGDARDLAGEGVQLVDHPVDGVLQFEDLAADVDGDLPGEVAFRDGGCDIRDVAHLGGEVARHGVHVVGQVAPCAGGAGHIGLAAQAPLGSDLAGDAGDLGGERIQLIDHHVDGVLELQNLTLNLDGDLFR